ncbi:DNA gyrase subunit A [Microvenator marinus]|uniref:DNA gyrase subunit A n=1 Tax=Microvenator marinus TaxID=2600177 RepID=A0A5B8XZC6_9DELT|nr:DNA gyrase subunit A [Microvenator marinus]QED29343.1 DNA gyrase subunit A [Microvenator marinus]
MTESPNIIPINIEDEIRHSYLDYAMSVIIGRALPDVRDGLKPVHRRILFAMHELGNRWNASYKKSARVVGDVIGKYHPHGDSAVYDALVRMAQDFNMRLPLVDGQGNFGSVDGDKAAAMRYTEARMARAAQEFLNDIEKNTIEWGPNYDESLKEPLVLPTKIPNLLVNGSSGIAVGMSTNIPPHNLGEVVRATLALIENPDMGVDELMQIMPGPDFPTGGIIYGATGIREAYETGRGIIRVRARADVEEDERSGKSSIIVTELPYQVNKAKLLERIAELVRDKKLEGVTDLRDESDRDGMRMVVELRRDVMPEVMLNNLFKMTAMQSSFGIINLAIVHGQPKIMPVTEILNHFVDFRRDVVTRRTIYELQQAEARAHILEGLKIALDHLDEVIALIRASPDGEAAKTGLMDTFGLSDRQAQAILDMRLQRLTGLERDKILQELAEIRLEIERLKGILADEGKLMAVIKEELESVLAQYETPRLTQIIASAGDLSMADLIAEEAMVVTVTHQGYVKRTAVTEYRAQKRGGKGRRGMATKDEDFVQDLFVASTHTDVLMFTSIGKVYKRTVWELPAGSPTTKGKPIVQLLNLTAEEKLTAIVPIEDFEEGKFILSATRNGIIKKTELMAYKNVHSGGIIALGLKDGDELITCRLVDEGDHVVLVSKEGQSIRFQEDETRPMGRGASGVFGMRFRENDELIAMEIIPKGTPDEGSLKLLTVTKKGYGKRTELGEYPIQGRGGKGVITIKTTERNGDVVSACLLDEGDQIIVITDHGQLIRTNAREISVYSRNTQGVRIMNIEGDEKIVSVARVKEEDIDDEDEVTAVPEGQVPPEIEAEEPVEETDAEPGAEENISSEEE